MTMQRDILKQYLRAGPSRRFDVGFFSRNLPKDSPADAYLFANAFLNGCILFKYVDLDERRGGAKGRLINTLIYLPYDNASPGEGGESVIFCKENLRQLCEYKLSAKAVDNDRLAADIEKLKVLDSLPTFSPFIVEFAFRRSQLTIPDCYLQLAPEVRATLDTHLMVRLRPLIVARCQPSGNIEKAVEDLTTKLFRLREPTDALPLIEALRLPPAIADEVLSSWIGIAYFEYEYSSLQPKLRELANWLARHADSGHQAASLVNAIRQKIRSDWNDIVAISMEYRESYDTMAFRGNMEPFVAFMGRARASYWRMGEVLGLLELAVAVWRHFALSVGERKLPLSQLYEFLVTLRDLMLVADRRDEHDGGSSPVRTGAPACLHVRSHP
jgi:hypothetical protein